MNGNQIPSPPYVSEVQSLDLLYNTKRFYQLKQLGSSTQLIPWVTMKKNVAENRMKICSLGPFNQKSYFISQNKKSLD